MLIPDQEIIEKMQEMRQRALDKSHHRTKDGVDPSPMFAYPYLNLMHALDSAIFHATPRTISADLPRLAPHQETAPQEVG